MMRFLWTYRYKKRGFSVIWKGVNIVGNQVEKEYENFQLENQEGLSSDKPKKVTITVEATPTSCLQCD